MMEGDKLVTFRLLVQHFGGAVRHISYFADETQAQRCRDALLEYYESAYDGYLPYVKLDSRLWWVVDKTAYSNVGHTVRAVKLHTMVTLNDTTAASTSVLDIPQKMFGEAAFKSKEKSWWRSCLCIMTLTICGCRYVPAKIKSLPHSVDDHAQLQV